MSPESISTEMTQLCINSLTAYVITLEEEELGYFTRKKLQGLSTWDEWKADEKKQIDQFYFQVMFREPKDLNGILKGSIILQTH